MGAPAPPYGPQYGHGYAFPHPPPPDPPELPAGALRWPRWPWWYAPAGVGIALVATLFVVGIIGGIVDASGGDPENSKGFLQGATLLQELIFVGAAVLLASRTARPRAWHFGLRRSRLWPTLGWAALGYFAFWAFAIVYGILVAPDEEQETLDDLGVEEGAFWLVAAGLLVIVAAPLAEELFFRGFFYRALRTKLPIALAAIIDGILFGLVHAGSTPWEVLPVLAILGVIFCLVYERTGSLFAVIALHALNNTLAFGVTTEEWGVAGAIGALMVASCFVVPRLMRASRTPVPA
jgi:membrane protease YdiL (CAAX protease family)